MEKSKKILIVQGHPNLQSLCCLLAEVYQEASTKNGHDCSLINLPKIAFNPNLYVGYKSAQSMEADLLQSQEMIREAEHLVFIFPSWWASMPALLKGFIDRVFLPEFAFKYQKKSPFPLKLLKGKTARIVITMDAPGWYYKWFNGAPGLKLLKKGTLEFCGIKPVNVTILDKIRYRSKEKINEMIQKVTILGKKGI